jgi:hypothetical protein
MPGSFDFDFVLNKNLELKYFPVTQASVAFKVTGPSDPVTLQSMRDAVSDEFKATQKKVNDFIQSRNAEISRLSFNERRQKKDIRLVDGGNETIQKFLTEFKKAADDELDAFVRNEEKKAKKLADAKKAAALSGLKWVISFAWTAVQGAKAAADVYGAEGPLKIYDGINGFIEALKDLYTLLCQLRDQFADEKTVRAKVKAGFKSLQSAGSFTESDVNSVSALVALYETKVLAMEASAKDLSSSISKAIAEVPEAGIKPEVTKEAEGILDERLNRLVLLQETLKKVEKQLLNFKLNLGAAKATAKKETPPSWLAWIASKGYELKDVAFDAWELNFAQAAQGLAEKAIDTLIKTYSKPEDVVIAF